MLTINDEGISSSNVEKSASGSDEDSDDDSSDDENAFPDTQLQSLPVNVEKENTADKYNLADYGEDSDEKEDAENTSSNGANVPKKKFITAKERRLMKKKNATEVTDEIKELQSQQQKQKEQSKQKQTAAKPKVVAAPPAPTRGRKGKAKKIKEKYADQDEEERQLRMELLGVSDIYLILFLN